MPENKKTNTKTKNTFLIIHLRKKTIKTYLKSPEAEGVSVLSESEGIQPYKESYLKILIFST